MTGHNVKVGLAVVISMAILVVAFSFIGGQRFTKKNTYRLNVVFDNVQGLASGAKVWLSGVEVGKVESVGLRPDGKAQVSLIIGNEYPIIRGSQFTISVGLLKDTILSIKNPEILPVKVTHYKNGDEVKNAGAPATLDDIVLEAHHALINVNDMLLSVKEIVGDESMKQNVFETVQNVNKTTQEAYELAKLLRQTGTDNQQDISEIIDNIRLLTNRLNTTAKDIDTLVQHANDVAGDPQFKAQIKDTVSRLNDTLKNLQDTTKSIKDLVTDKEVQSDLRDTIKSTNSTMQNADVALKGFSKAIRTINDTKVNPSFEFRYNSRESKFHADMNLRLYPPDPTVSYMLGIDDLGTNSASNLMLGVKGSDTNLWYRVGIRGGKLGIGADWDRGKYIYESDMLDPNDLHWNLRMGKKLNGDNLYFMGGLEGIMKDNDISAGFQQKY